MSDRRGDEAVGDDPDIYYVPGISSYYSYEYNTIVLDERLKDFPEAHDIVLEHELEHAKPENRQLLNLLKLEFKTDVGNYFGRNEAVDEYFQNREPDRRISRSMAAKFQLVYSLRALWCLVLRPVGRLYQRLSAVAGGWWRSARDGSGEA